MEFFSFSFCDTRRVFACSSIDLMYLSHRDAVAKRRKKKCVGETIFVSVENIDFYFFPFIWRSCGPFPRILSRRLIPDVYPRLSWCRRSSKKKTGRSYFFISEVNWMAAAADACRDIDNDRFSLLFYHLGSSVPLPFTKANRSLNCDRGDGRVKGGER